MAGIYGKDGRKTRSGLMLAALIDMAYLTGQRIGDLLSLQWSAFGPGGIVFKPTKTLKTTGGQVLIEWTPKLRDVERRLKEMRVEKRAFGAFVFTKQVNKKGMAAAAGTLAERREFRLPAKKFDAFVAALDAPAKTRPRLERLLKAPGVLE